MADVNLGDVRASLRIDTGDFARGIDEANRRLADLARQLQAMQQAQQGTQQSSQLVARAIQDLAQVTLHSSQAYQQAAQQALAYRQEQDRLREATRQQREEQTRATEGWRQLLQVAGGVGIATGFSAMTSQMVGFAKSVVDVGVQMQQLRVTLGAIAGDASAGARQFQFLVDVGNRLGFSISSLGEGFRSFSAATRGTVLQGAETQKIFEGVATAARAFGASNAQVTQALLALEQMVSKGTVSMEELRRQLGNAIPGAFGLAAKAMGVTTEELNALVTSGELRAIPFVRAFGAYLNELGPQAEKTANTVGSAFTRLNNQITLFKDNLAQSGILDFLRDAANATARWIEQLNKASAAQRQLQEAQTTPMGGVRREDIAQLSQEQQRRLAQVQRLINEQQVALQDPNAAPMFSPSRSEYLQQLKDEEAAILAQTQAFRAQREEREKVRTEQTKARAESQRDVDALEAIRKKLDDVGKAQAALSRQGLFAPELGTESGTADQLKTMQAQRQAALQTALEDLFKLTEQRPRTAGPLPQDIQARIASLREQYSSIEQAMKAQDDAEKALATSRRETEQAQRRAEQQREQAIRQEISLTTELGRLQTYLGAAGQSTAEQARMQAHQEGLALQQSAQRALETIRQNPFIPRELAAQFEAGLAQLPAVVAQRAEEAFRKTDEQLRARTTAMGDQISQVAERLSAAGLAPLDADLARITRTFEEMRRQLLALQAALQESRGTATEAGQAAIDAQLARVQAQLPLVDPAMQQALRERQERPERDELQRLRTQLATLQAQRNERIGVRAELRAADAFQDPGRREEADRLIAQIKAQERLNHYMELFEQLGNSVGNAWVNALQGIAQGTQTVGAAFKAMAQSIMQSMAQIASQEAFKGLIKMAAGMLFGGGGQQGGGAMGGDVSMGSTGFSGLGSTSTGAIGGTGEFAEGGIVNRPTFALLGENAANNPEVVMNRHQMQAFMRAAPSAGGQATGGVTIINVPNMAAAEEEQARQRAMGRDAVINIVASEMAQGDRSQLLKIVRLTGR